MSAPDCEQDPILEGIGYAPTDGALSDLWQCFRDEWTDVHTAAVRARLVELSSAATEVRTS